MTITKPTYDELLDAVTMALPYVEDALDYPEFKKERVQRLVNHIRSLIEGA